MNFDLTEEQQQLQHSLAGYLRRHYQFEQRGAALNDSGWRPEIWRGLAQDLGLFRAALPLASGGFGGGPVETMLIMEAFGTVLLQEPYLEAIVMAIPLLRDGGTAADEIAQRAMEGEAIVIPALYETGTRFNLARTAATAERVGDTWQVTGDKIAVVGGPQATHFVCGARPVSDAADGPELSLFLIDAEAPELRRNDYRLIDGRPASDVSLRGAPAIRLGSPDDAAERLDLAVDVGVAALCAEAVGVMQVMLAQTVDYAHQRHQFGQSIELFQVLQHRMVDMFNHAEQTRSLAIMAALSLALPVTERRRAVSAAKSFVSDAIALVAQAAVQVHGGIGTTQECAISHYFRRATVISHQFGSAAHHRRRLAQMSRPGVERGDGRIQHL